MAYIAWTVIFRRLKRAIGNEALTLISYARRFTDPPRLSQRHQIA
jgi:hypothetical protein